MADCKDNKRLIERLRLHAESASFSATFPYATKTILEVIDALEAMQKEIKRMEMEDDGVREKLVTAKQRIAELEGDLEVMRLQRDAKRWTRENHDN